MAATAPTRWSAATTQAAALTHAEQLRAAHEFPTLAGSATVPFLTDYYQIGDRVKIVQGRNASLQINVGVDQGEAPTYPWITAFAWDFSGDKQHTVLAVLATAGRSRKGSDRLAAVVSVVSGQ